MMVRESRYIKVGLIPCGTTEKSVSDHFLKYGKVQSVRVEEHPECVEAVVAFTDIKAASQAYNEDQLLGGAAPLSIAFCDAAGTTQSESRCPTLTPAKTESSSSPTAADRGAGTDKEGSNSPESSSRSRERWRSKSPSRRRGKSKSPHLSRSRSRSNSTGSSPSSRTSRSRKSDVTTKPGSVGDNNTNRGNLGVKITHLPLRSSDTSLRDGLFHEYKKHGKVSGVVIDGKEANRSAIVSFKKPEEAEKALEASREKHFFGSQIRVESHVGFICDAPEEESEEPEYDEYHAKATRTLFCGNLEPHTSSITLRDTFKKYGDIVDIEIKKQGAASSYAFVQFSDIKSVVQVLRRKDGVHIGSNKIKLGFGKSMPTSCVWLDDLPEAVTEIAIKRAMARYGMITEVVLDKVDLRALVSFQATDQAVAAVNEMKIRPLFMNKRLMVDFASWDFQDKYRDKLGLPAPPSIPPRRGDNDRYVPRGGGIDGADRSGMLRGRGEDRYANNFNDRAGTGGRYNRTGPPGNNADFGARGSGDTLPRWNDSGSISPLDQRREKSTRGGRSEFRGYESPASRSGYDEFYKGRRRSISPGGRSGRRSMSPSSRTSRHYRFSRSPPNLLSSSRGRSHYSRSPPSLSNPGLPRSPRSPRKSTMSPSTPTRDEHSMDIDRNSRDGDRRSRRDDYRRSTRHEDARGSRNSRVSELQRLSGANTPSRDSDAESVGSGGDHMDELQRKRIELLSQLKGLECDSPTPDSMTANTKWDSDTLGDSRTVADISMNDWGATPHTPTQLAEPNLNNPAERKDPRLPDNQPNSVDNFNESLDARLSIREQYEKIRQQSDTLAASSASQNAMSTSSGAKKTLEKTMSNSPKSDCSASTNLSTSFKKRKKEERERPYRRPSSKGPEEIPVSGAGPSREQVIELWDTLRLRPCMLLTKPFDLALPKFAMSLMQSPRSPGAGCKRYSMDSPLSSPTLPSPALKAFSDFSTEKIPIIKTDMDDLEADENEGGLSPTSRDIQERIRKLNERLSIADKAMSQAPKDIRPAIDLSKYKIVRKPKIENSFSVNSVLLSSVISSSAPTANIWSRTSIFDQDCKRLEGYQGVGSTPSAPVTGLTPLTPLSLTSTVPSTTDGLTVPGASDSLHSSDTITSTRDRLQAMPGMAGMTIKTKAMYKDVAPISPHIVTRPAVSDGWKPPIDPQPAATPVKGILRRASSSEGGKSLWTGADPRTLAETVRAQPLQDNRPTQDARMVAEVKPMEVKQEREMVVEAPPIKKEPSYNRYDFPIPIKQERPDHSAYESSFGRQTEVKHEPKPTTTSSTKRSKHEYKPHIDLFKPDDNAVISTSGTDRKRAFNTAVRSSSSSETTKDVSTASEKTKEKTKLHKEKKHDKKSSKSDQKLKTEKTETKPAKTEKSDISMNRSKSVDSVKTEKSDKQHKRKDKHREKELEKEKEREEKEREEKEREEKERERERQEKEREQQEKERERLEREKELEEREREKERERERKRQKELEEERVAAAERKRKREEEEREREREEQEQEQQKELERRRRQDEERKRQEREEAASKAESRAKAKAKQQNEVNFNGSKKNRKLVKGSSTESVKSKSRRAVKEERDTKQETKRKPSRVMESASSDESSKDEDEQPTASDSDSSLERGGMKREKTEEEKANWMAEYAPFFESMYDKVKRKRGASAKAAQNMKNKKKMKTKRRHKSLKESNSDDTETEDGRDEDSSPMSSPVRTKPATSTGRKSVMVTSESEDQSPERSKPKKTKAPEITNSKSRSQVKKEKAVKKVKLPPTPPLPKDSDSESESEADAARSNEIKKKALANLWRRAPGEASKKRTAASAARGKKQSVPVKPKSPSKKRSATSEQSSSADESEVEESKSLFPDSSSAKTKLAQHKGPATKRQKRQQGKVAHDIPDDVMKAELFAAKKPGAKAPAAKGVNKPTTLIQTNTTTASSSSSSSTGSGSSSSGSSSSGSSSGSNSSSSDSDSSSSSGVKTKNAPPPQVETVKPASPPAKVNAKVNAKTPAAKPKRANYKARGQRNSRGKPKPPVKSEEEEEEEEEVEQDHVSAGEIVKDPAYVATGTEILSTFGTDVFPQSRLVIEEPVTEEVIEEHVVEDIVEDTTPVAVALVDDNSLPPAPTEVISETVEDQRQEPDEVPESKMEIIKSQPIKQEETSSNVPTTTLNYKKLNAEPIKLKPHQRTITEEVSRHMDEVIYTVSQGNFTPRGSREVLSPTDATSPPAPSKAKGRKRQLTSSSSDSMATLPSKRSTPSTSSSVHGMRSPPSSAGVFDSIPLTFPANSPADLVPCNSTPSSTSLHSPSMSLPFATSQAAPIPTSTNLLPRTSPLLSSSPPDGGVPAVAVPEPLLPATVAALNLQDAQRPSKPKVTVAPNNSIPVETVTTTSCAPSQQSLKENDVSNHLPLQQRTIGASTASSKRQQLSSSSSVEQPSLPTPTVLSQLSTSSTESSSITSPNNQQLRGPSFPMQQPTSSSSSTSLPSPHPSNSATSTNGGTATAGNGTQTTSRPQSAGEKTWDLAVDTHIQKSLKKEYNMASPHPDMLMMPHNSLTPGRMGMLNQRQQRSPARSIPQSMHSPGGMMNSAPHMPMHHQLPPEMMFPPYHHAHAGAAGDHMTRPPAHFPGFMAAPWPAGGAGQQQQHGEMPPQRYLMQPMLMQQYHHMHQMQMAAQHAAAAQQQSVQSPLNSPLPLGLPTMMQAPVQPHGHHVEDRKPVAPPTQQPAATPQTVQASSQEVSSGYVSPEERLREAMSGCPVVWQGTLALKTDTAGVEMFFLCGNQALPDLALPGEEEGLRLLRIAQRMKLEKQQLDGVDGKMKLADDFCLLLALPSADSKLLDSHQTSCLQTGFIEYLREKDAAGIINVPKPGGHEPAYVVHVFHPCEFSMKKVEELKPDMSRTAQGVPHLVIIIATV